MFVISTSYILKHKALFTLQKFEPSIYVIGELGTQAAVLVLGTRGKSWSQYVDYGKIPRPVLRGAINASKGYIGETERRSLCQN